MLGNKSILAIIPARGGSKGVPGKNLRLIQGKTLLAHAIDIAKHSKYIDEIMVSSDDVNILNEAKKTKAVVPLIRPPELATDHATTMDVVIHAVETNSKKFDYVLILQVTSPLRETKDIDDAIEHCLAKQSPACVSVCETSKSPYWMFNLSENHRLTPIIDSPHITSPRQAVPKTYLVNGALYLAEISWLIAHKTFFSEQTIGFVMPIERSLDIDNEVDFAVLNFYLGCRDKALV